MILLTGLLIVVGMGLSGLLLWRWVSPRLSGLHAENTVTFTGWAAIAGYAVQFAAAMLLVKLLPASDDLVDRLALQVGAAAVAAAVVLALMARRPEGVAALGLRGRRGPSALVVALAAWLAFYPVFVGVAWLNTQALTALGYEAALQEPLRLFLADPEARTSPLAWGSIVLLLPAFEELIFRGGIYGALRRTLHPALAVAASALLFGLAHEPVAAAPAAALGVMLAILYERTGSLAAPLAFHALHNGVTLLVATLAPGMLT